MQRLRRLTALTSLVVVVSGAWPSAHAQSYPSRPIRLIIGSFPGGGIDFVGRVVAQKMSENIGQQVIVDNRGGANGIIGMDAAAKASADGHTFYMGTAGHIGVNPVLVTKLPFDIEKDFSPLTLAATLPFLIYVHASLPIKSLPELIEHAKANPGKLTWSSSGDGGLPHLSGELIRLASRIDTRRIPYKGSAPAFNDLVGGRVNYCIEVISIGASHVKAGRLNVIATTAPKRLPMFPSVPAVAETLPGVEILNWYGTITPSGVPKATAARLYEEFVKALKDPEIVAKLATSGFDADGRQPAEFAAFRRAEQARWGKVIEQAGVRKK